jgi:hypothetical protein
MTTVSVDAGEEDAEPVQRIGPVLDDREAGLRKQVLCAFDCEFVTVLGVYGFATPKRERQVK